MTNSLHQLTHDIQTRVREIAYMMWESAGRHQGMALDYWLAAEKEVLTTFQAATERMVPTTKATVAGAPAKPQPAMAAEQAASAAPAAPEAPAASEAPPVETAAIAATTVQPKQPKQPTAKPAPRRSGGRSKTSA